MAISIEKILDVFREHDALTAKVILTDGADKRVTYLGGLTDDDSATTAAINSRIDELWSKGVDYNGVVTNINSASKSFKDGLPDAANINAAASVPALRTEVAKLRDAVEELRGMINA